MQRLIGATQFCCMLVSAAGSPPVFLACMLVGCLRTSAARHLKVAGPPGLALSALQHLHLRWRCLQLRSPCRPVLPLQRPPAAPQLPSRQGRRWVALEGWVAPEKG